MQVPVIVAALNPGADGARPLLKERGSWVIGDRPITTLTLDLYVFAGAQGGCFYGHHMVTSYTPGCI